MAYCEAMKKPVIIDAEYTVVQEVRRELAINWRRVPTFLMFLAIFILSRLLFHLAMTHHWFWPS